MCVNLCYLVQDFGSHLDVITTETTEVNTLQIPIAVMCFYLNNS